MNPVPDVVIEAIYKFSPTKFESLLRGLRWSFDHYSFDFAGMYVGVELDGYIHT